MKLNDTIKHIFKEAILDLQQGAFRGDASVLKPLENFQKFLELGEVPLGYTDFVYRYYQNQSKDLAKQDDPRLRGLKSEVQYMVNYLNSNYTFEETDGMLVVTLKE